MIATALVNHGAELAGTPPRELAGALLAISAAAAGALIVGLARR